MKSKWSIALLGMILVVISVIFIPKLWSKWNEDPEWERVKKIVADSHKNLPKNEYEKHNLIAEAYFENPKTILLCKAIEENDPSKVKSILAMGANANDRGKDGASPLFWSFPKNRIEIVRILLEHGADPNAKIEVEIGDIDWWNLDTFMLFSCRTHMGYFDDVIAHGGDPHRYAKSHKSTTHVALTTSSGDRERRVLKLLDMGANINETYNGRTILQSSLGCGFELTLQLLERNADPFILDEYSAFYFSHDLFNVKRRQEIYYDPKYRPLIENLFDEMKRRGEDFDAVRREIDDWYAYNQIDKFGERSRLQDEWRQRVVKRVEAIKNRNAN